jgi:hypothetical protein
MRLMRMRRTALVLVLLPLVACGGGGTSTLSAAQESGSPSAVASPASSVPPEFRPACGNPGAKVVTDRLRVTIRHADCDLTGVVISNQGRGVTVPEPGFGVGGSGGVDIAVDEDTGDVTFTAEAEVAQY